MQLNYIIYNVLLIYIYLLYILLTNYSWSILFLFAKVLIAVNHIVLIWLGNGFSKKKLFVIHWFKNDDIHVVRPTFTFGKDLLQIDLYHIFCCRVLWFTSTWMIILKFWIFNLSVINKIINTHYLLYTLFGLLEV